MSENMASLLHMTCDDLMMIQHLATRLSAFNLINWIKVSTYVSIRAITDGTVPYTHISFLQGDTSPREPWLG